MSQKPASQKSQKSRSNQKSQKSRPDQKSQKSRPNQKSQKSRSASQTYQLKTPLSKEDVLKLNAGDVVYLTGTVLTARDAAHLRMIEWDGKKQPFPFDLKNAVIYHCGPVMEASKNGWNAVAAGPTTSDRLTKMTPAVLKYEIRALIGKGGMENIAGALRQKCVYLSYTGGCAATAADMIRVSAVYWEDLGMPEAVWELAVKEFGPLIVGVDAHGNDLFKAVKEKAEAVFRKQFQNKDEETVSK